MSPAKLRTEIPDGVAAEVLFRADRTCCVCRVPGLQVQIHHINGDPSNHDSTNLAVMCLQDHALTEVRGGFGRHLSQSQVVKYRDDWHERVAFRREQADIVAIRTMTRVEETESILEHTATKRVETLRDYMVKLTVVRAAAVEHAQPGWDGSTADMLQASYAYIDVLEAILVALASYYPPSQFGKPPREYFSALIASRYFWHRAHLEPEGPGTGGTIVSVETAGAVIADVEGMVVELVRSLATLAEGFDFDRWEAEWNAKAPEGV